ncbi:MAG TPA: DUF917 domain-containing protein [Verrucomicrobiae bacterium]|nr:DUF917 domain-containing protein [Verrucomicrobiae bacterium]
MARLIAADDLADIARGAAVLGTGGGGDPYLGMLLAQLAIRAHGPVTLVELDEVPDSACCADAGGMGAPTVGVEKLASGDEHVRAFLALETALGRPLTHVICGEAGGSNSTLPFVVAAHLGRPLVDGDAMGRAFPELQMAIPAIYGVSACPLALADQQGNVVILTAIDNRWTERIARAVTIEMGCTAALSSYVMDGATARRSLVPGTISLCQELGRLIVTARAAHDDPVERVVERLGGRRLFGGRVTDVGRRTESGFARGHALIAGADRWRDQECRVEFQNEHLVAIRDGQLVASVPDLIIVLDTDTAEPVTTEQLRYGLRVTVVAAPCDPRWRSPAGLALVGPRYFGYAFDHVPVEDGGD